MKKIKLNGKLNLNKETISKLNDPQMRDVKGGAVPTTTYDERSNKRCDTDNTLSWGEWCTNVADCEHNTDGLFCRPRD